MHEAATQVCKDEAVKRLGESVFVGIMLDESLDIAVQKKLVVVFKLVVNGKPQMHFGGNIEVENGKAETIVNAVLKVLNDHQIPMDKVIGLGTDGASVMVGRLNGVSTSLRRLNPCLVNVWCCVHRLSLVCHWAAQSGAALKTLQDTLVRIFKYFKYSAIRMNNLKRLKHLMDKVKKLKKPTAVPWLSLHDAVVAAQESWGCLVLQMEHEATSNEGDSALALCLLREVKTYKFISLLCILRDVLEPIAICSKVFQKDDIDIENSSRMLKATLDSIIDLSHNPGQYTVDLNQKLNQDASYQGISFTASDALKSAATANCRRFVVAIQREAEKRFPPEDMSTLKSLNLVLNPKHLPQRRDEIINHGEGDLEALLEAFPQLDAERARRGYRLFKYYLSVSRHLSLQETCTEIIQQDQSPDFVVLANICLVIPLTSVPCERCFSLQNRVVSSARNRMSVKSQQQNVDCVFEGHSV